jgi:hypothetical protein
LIVLDENLKDPQVTAAIHGWYRGRVCSINELRPATTIKDEAIPMLLRAHSGCVFITENESDFWRRPLTDPNYCVIALGAGFEPEDVSIAIRAVLRLKGFRTRKERLGKLAKVSHRKVEYYTHWSSTVVSLDLRIG